MGVERRGRDLAQGGLPRVIVGAFSDAAASAFGGQQPRPNKRQARALTAAGFQLGSYVGGEFIPERRPRTPPAWLAPWGAIIGNQQAQLYARDLLHGRALPGSETPPASQTNTPAPSLLSFAPWLAGLTKGPLKRRGPRKRKRKTNAERELEILRNLPRMPGSYDDAPTRPTRPGDDVYELPPRPTWPYDNRDRGIDRNREDPSDRMPVINPDAPDFVVPDRRAIIKAFVGNVPPIPVEIPVAVSRAVLGPIAWVLGAILFPSRTADDDEIPESAPAPTPKGPPRRARVGRTRTAWPPPDWYNWARPDDPGHPVPGPVPTQQPHESPAPAPAPAPESRPLPIPTPAPLPAPTRLPNPSAPPRPLPVPTPSPIPSPPSWFDPLLPLLPSLVQRPQLRPARPPTSQPLTPPQAGPLAFAPPLPLANPSDPCERTRARRKRKQGCRNPVVSRRLQTRGGTRYSITTRKLQCPVSSRKKPPSPRAR